jgi:dTDP-4-amino-4,6-dideoxygalactose transaminase
MYWITEYLPFLNLGKTVYTTDYPVRQYSPYLGSFALRLFTRIDELTTQRQKNAEILHDVLAGNKMLKFIKYVNNSEPVNIRFPVLIESQSTREKLLNLLITNGIGASLSYPSAIADIPEIQNDINKNDLHMPAGRLVAREILTLPTHPYVTARHIETIKKVIDRISG